MKSIFLSFFIPFLAGISTLLGYLSTYFPIRYQKLVIGGALSFSAGVMLTISIGSLLPESFFYLQMLPLLSQMILLLLFFLLGVFTCGILNYFSSSNEDSLYHIGILSFLALVLHNIPEGITTFLTTTINLRLGIALSFAIAFHNIPEGILIAVPIYYASGNRRKAFLYTFLSGFSELVGAVIAFLFLKDHFNVFFFAFLLSFVAGIMIHLSIREIFPKALSYLNLFVCLAFFLIGFLLMLFCLFIL